MLHRGFHFPAERSRAAGTGTFIPEKSRGPQGHHSGKRPGLAGHTDRMGKGVDAVPLQRGKIHFHLNGQCFRFP